MKATGVALPARFQTGDVAVHPLPVNASPADDAQRTAALASAERARAVVVDSYDVDHGYYRVLKRAGLGVVAIHDAEAMPEDADVVVNQSISGIRTAPERASRPRYLLGSRYALLREEFASLHAQPKPIPVRTGRLLVTLGGADPGNHTLKVVRALARLGDEVQVDVILGPHYTHDASLAEIVEPARRRPTIYRDPPDLPRLMHRADLAVGAAGTTVWELACLGVPSLVVIAAHNQLANAQYLAERGIVLNLGWAKEVHEDDLAGAVARLASDPAQRNAMSRAGRAQVDGLGTERVAQVFAELFLPGGAPTPPS